MKNLLKAYLILSQKWNDLEFHWKNMKAIYLSYMQLDVTPDNALRGVNKCGRALLKTDLLIIKQQDSKTIWSREV